MRRSLLLVPALLAALPAPAAADEPMPVAASFSILGDLVGVVGGDRVAVTTLVGPDGDAHVFEPSPSDARAVAGARVLFVNGLGFEGWMDRLVESAAYQGPVVTAAAAVKPAPMEGEEGHDAHDAHEGHDHAAEEAHDHAEDAHDHAAKEADAGHDHDHGGIDPHAWQDAGNAILYVKAIEAGLAAADPAGAATYAANAAAYIAKLEALDASIRSDIAALPAERRRAITSHDAFGYFERAYGLDFVAPEGVSTESEASAADVARIIEQIRAEKIPAVFVENISDPRLIERIAAETGAAIGGTLYSDALSGPDGPAATYLDMMTYNARTLTAALKPNS